MDVTTTKGKKFDMTRLAMLEADILSQQAKDKSQVCFQLENTL